MGSSSAQSFTSIPVLDYSLSSSPDTKPRFLSELRNAVVNVGFFYLVHTPIAPHVQQAFIEKSLALCDLPLEKKLEIEMVNSKHFLGYSRLGAETTASKTDYREQFDVSAHLAQSPTYAVD
jgi:isopenicillin N synthase-like dioxygenase